MVGNSFFSPYVPDYPTFSAVPYYLPGEATPTTVNFPDSSQWTDFFNTINITRQTYDYNPTLYQDLFTSTYVQYFAKQTAAGEVISEATWLDFLNTSDAAMRVRAPFMWVFNLLLQILAEQQQFTIAEGNRTTALVNAQSSAVSAIGNVRLITNGDGNTDMTRGNQNRQLYVQIYNSWNSIVGNREGIASNNIQTGNQAIQQQTTLMTGLIQQVQTIVSQLFSS